MINNVIDADARGQLSVSDTEIKGRDSYDASSLELKLAVSNFYFISVFHIRMYVLLS